MNPLNIPLPKIKQEIAKRSFEDFVLYTMPSYQINWHHRLLMQKLQLFAEGKIKKLMVFMPPQHGKSELTSRRLPSYILGLNPDAKIIGCSYASTLAASFNRDVQRIIQDEEYQELFPNTSLNSTNVKTSAKGSYLKNSDIFEVVGAKGFYKSVGVGGSLTGTPADFGIIDDPIKDAVEAESATYRAKVWNWFTQVFLTRLHNGSQIIVTQTRWHQDDLAGRILKQYNTKNDWVVLSLPAIKEPSATLPGDIREPGQALWPSKHSLERLIDIRQANERAFHALYQQDPRPFEGGLIYKNWRLCSEEEYQALKIEAVCGLDFGFSNSPAALVIVKIDTEKKRIFVKEGFYQTHLMVHQLIEKSKFNLETPKGKIIADSADPLLINEMQKAGLNVHKAWKGPGSVEFGIKMLQSMELVIVSSSKNIIKELQSYAFKQDADGKALEEPMKENDHALDAIRYAVVDKYGKRSNKFVIG